MKSKGDAIISWLLDGDPSIQYQTSRDLLSEGRPDLQEQISSTGWGHALLSRRKENGHWGDRFYQPKWISTHYTLLDLRNLNISPKTQVVKDTLIKVVGAGKAGDGGIPLGPSTKEKSDICVNGMFLNYASYFEMEEEHLQSVVDNLLDGVMPDGGFNCRKNRSGARHSSLHSTISVLEGIYEYLKNGYTYRRSELQSVKSSAEEFILLHQLFLSDRTGAIIHKSFLNFPYPSRWKYDILRGMDYFQYAQRGYDERMQPAMDVILQKKKKNGTWNVNAPYPGQVYFVMEEAGKSSRWNTLRALRVLGFYGIGQRNPGRKWSLRLK